MFPYPSHHQDQGVIIAFETDLYNDVCINKVSMCTDTSENPDGQPEIRRLAHDRVRWGVSNLIIGISVGQRNSDDHVIVVT